MEPTTPSTVEVVERLATALAPTLSVMGAVLLALINRGIKKSVEEDEKGKEQQDKRADSARGRDKTGSYAAGKFNAALLHHIAVQEKRIGELEAQLSQSDIEKKELMIMNIRVQKENADLHERANAQEERLNSLEEVLQQITANAS